MPLEPGTHRPQGFLARQVSGFLLVGLIATLTSCSHTEKEIPTVPALTTRHELFEFANRTAAVLGGDWDTPTIVGPDPCSMTDGRVGHTFSLQVFGPAQPDPAAAAKAISTLWNELGYEVEPRWVDQHSVVLVLVPPQPDRFSMEFDASTHAAVFEARSRCTPGEGTGESPPAENASSGAADSP